MTLPEHFKTFHKKISLKQERIDRIKSAHKGLRDALEVDEEIKGCFLDSYLQGSYPTDTATCPTGEQKEFDVDVVLVMNLKKKFGKLPAGTEALKWLLERIRKAGYQDKAYIWKRCIRIDYAGEFHMDVIPGHTEGDPHGKIQIPMEWEESNPWGFIKWCREAQDKSNGKFTRTGKMVKWWRNRVFNGNGPRSILLITLIGEHIHEGGDSDAEALTLTLENIAAWIEPLEAVPQIWNPSLPGENLARDWSQEQFAIFKQAIQKAAALARQALDEQDEEKSIQLWKELFDGTFPGRTEGEGREMAAAVNAGRAAVSSAGILMATKPSHASAVQVPQHRFYGEKPNKNS